jgi:hypothetical protein
MDVFIGPKVNFPLQYIKTCVFQNTLQKAIIDGDTVLLLKERIFGGFWRFQVLFNK